jgi:TolB-like protein
MQLRQLVTEIRRRRVFSTVGIYIVAAWVAVQVASLVFPAIDVPDSALKFVWLAALSIFPLALIFSWFFDVSLNGIQRTEPLEPGVDFDPSLRRADLVIISALAIVAVSLVLQFSFRIERKDTPLDIPIEDFSIAVLPFDELTGNPDEQFFASGMQAALIGSLSRIRAMRVTSKISTLGFKGAGVLLHEVAERLRVARIVEGQVLRSGNQVSISVQLLDARKDEHIWSATFEDELSNIMFLQNRMSQEIANQVRVNLGPEEREEFRRAQAVMPEAYLAFLRGVFHVERFNPEDMAIAATHFQRAVDIDPDYALGYWGLSKLCGFQAQIGLLTPDEAQQRCGPLTDRALELDPFLPEGYLGRALFATWQRFDWEEARPNFERAVELNPSYAEAHVFYAHYLGIVGELKKSTEHMEMAIQLDPLNPFLRGLYSAQIFMTNDYLRAIEEAEYALELAPGNVFSYVVLCQAHTELGNEDEAVKALASFIRHAEGDPETAEILETKYKEMGFEASMLSVGEAMAELAEKQHVPLGRITTLYILGGEYEKAIDWLEYAYEQSDPNAPYAGVSIKNKNVRNHPRFQALLRRMGLDYWADNP